MHVAVVWRECSIMWKLIRLTVDISFVHTQSLSGQYLGCPEIRVCQGRIVQAIIGKCRMTLCACVINAGNTIKVAHGLKTWLSRQLDVCRMQTW
jgi:hypothetical protein